MKSLAEAAKISEPPESKSKDMMDPFEPERVAFSSWVPLEMSQILTFRSEPPVAIVRP